MNINISINVPVRKNCPWIKGLVESFIKNTSDPSKVELILGIDHNDTTTRFFADNIKMMILDKRGQKMDLWIFNNKMCEMARGKLLWDLPDDFLIMTPNYDQMLLPFTIEAETKVFRVMPKPQEGGDFHPLYSRKYYNLMGRMGLHDIVSYNNTLFEKLPIERNIQFPALYIKDRRVTGELNNDVYFTLPDGNKVNATYFIPSDADSAPNGWGWDKKTFDEIDKDAAILLKAIKEGA